MRNLIDIENERFEWSSKVFPESTSISSLKHLIKEINEIENDINKGERRPEEYADAIFLIFDSARRQKNPITPEEIVNACEEKLKINKSRFWVKNKDNSYSHKK